jgi:hypothetical protein
LHRGANLPNAGQRAKNLKDAKGKEREIYGHFVAVRNELRVEREESFWKWARNV